MNPPKPLPIPDPVQAKLLALAVIERAQRAAGIRPKQLRRPQPPPPIDDLTR